MLKTHISERGQITIPASVRRKLGWEEGRELEIALLEGEVVLRPVKSVAQLEGIFHEYAGRRRVSWDAARQEMEEAVAREVCDE
jgi:AbrB family looped-hinge helix DNA binding protein